MIEAEQQFLERAGVVAGSRQHLDTADQKQLTVELLSSETLNTSEIEGELLNRHSVQASIRHALGLEKQAPKTPPAEAVVADMMIDLYQLPKSNLNEETLFHWHELLMRGRNDLEQIGSYREFEEPMQIVSGPDYQRKIHFEAPPSKQVSTEMKHLLSWINHTAPHQKNALPPVTRAGIAHLWFECIHPFEDGNGRIGRAIAEHILSEHQTQKGIVILAKTLLKRKKKKLLLRTWQSQQNT